MLSTGIDVAEGLHGWPKSSINHNAARARGAAGRLTPRPAPDSAPDLGRQRPMLRASQGARRCQVPCWAIFPDTCVPRPPSTSSIQVESSAW